ncbi:hypothetical protein ACERII_06255 [Evansella sp. AB-rgal1]|uniref:hypothetical protein n=1 Tax=Evansella sp. AB-rgal1 TaxID=3242696 RepID=UPI00359D15CF
MPDHNGMEYAISNQYKDIFFHAETMIIFRQNEKSVQFRLKDHNGPRGYGTMPIQNFLYLLKKKNLQELPNNRLLLEKQLLDEENQEQIG